MTGWHASDDLVTRYASGSLPEPDAWSLEKHLESCGGCAARVSLAVRETAAGVVLADVREAVLGAGATRTAPGTGATRTAPGARTGRGARASAAPGAPGPSAPVTSRARLWASRRLTPAPAGSRTARVLWAAGPAVRGAWPAAVLGVALAAVLLARFADFAGARPLLLAVAPVVPIAGVALSYGAHTDPLHEIAAATPSAGLRLVLTRTAAVLAVSLPLLTLAGFLVPSSGAPGAAAWLLPGLALTLASLALAGYVGFRAATAVTGGGWLCAVLSPVLSADGRLTARLAEQVSACLGGATAQGGWAAAAVLCAALLAARRSAYDRLERR
ncbi:zf-HC2 domain-containing protein [Streptomyces viridochromogenes]|uniref:Putative Integral membrane protein n=1 Tax=Streptomyces viridochromogenes Tue57 TaxID=1160705 RepID=L8PA15_STRVR|nr:zf-HC2 domain-containing protein [Streptomyces viridochromogenes]ELS53265.1 putative Integral membrane protein [Streptomyces viridochromogenes Tue57]